MSNRVRISSRRYSTRVTAASSLAWVLSCCWCWCCLLATTHVCAMKGGRPMGGVGSGFGANYPSRRQSQTKNRAGGSTIRVDSSSKKRLFPIPDGAPFHPFLPRAFPGLDAPAVAASLGWFVRDRVCPATKRFAGGVRQTFRRQPPERMKADLRRNKKWREIADGGVSAVVARDEKDSPAVSPIRLAFAMIRIAVALDVLREEAPYDAWDRLVPACKHGRDRLVDSVRRGVRRLGTPLDLVRRRLGAASIDLWLFRVFAVACTPRAAFVLGATAGTIAVRLWKPMAVVLAARLLHRSNNNNGRARDGYGTRSPRCRTIPYSLGISSGHRKQRGGGTILRAYYSNRVCIYSDRFRDPPKPPDGRKWKQKAVQGFVAGVASGLASRAARCTEPL